MSYKSILTYTDSEARPEGHVSLAIDLTRRFDAHLTITALGCDPDAPPSAFGDFPGIEIADVFAQRLADGRATVPGRGPRARHAAAVAMSGASFLVTGGAGFLGINLVRFLLGRGQSVRSLDTAAFDYPERNRVTVIEGDIRDPDAVRRAMAGVDIVVHAAAALPLYSPAEIRSVEVDGTRCLLEVARSLGVARFVYISSTAVYGIPDHHPIREGDRLAGVGPYGEAKIAAEALCAAAREAGMCVPILRPKSFVGPERLGVFAMLYEWAADGHNFPVLGRGDNRYQLLDVEDLCQAIWLTATLEADRDAPDRQLVSRRPLMLRKRGVETKLVLGGVIAAEPDQSLIRLIADARSWARRLLEGEVGSVRALARQLGLDHRHVARALPLAFLAPDIVAAILEGRQPVALTATRLKRLSVLPSRWEDQRQALGFHGAA